MSKARSKTPATKKTAQKIVFEQDHYYYYKQSDDKFYLFKARQNAHENPELKNFQILGDLSDDKNNLFYQPIKLKLNDFNSDYLMKEDIPVKVQTKNYKGLKTEMVVVSKTQFSKIKQNCAKIQTEASKRPQKSEKQETNKRKQKAEESEEDEEIQEEEQKSNKKAKSKIKEEPKSKSKVVEKKKQTQKGQQKKAVESESEEDQNGNGNEDEEEEEEEQQTRKGRSKTPVQNNKKNSQIKQLSQSKTKKSASKSAKQSKIKEDEDEEEEIVEEKQGRKRAPAQKKGKQGNKQDENEDYPIVTKRNSTAKDAFFNRRQLRQQKKQELEDKEDEQEEEEEKDELDSSQESLQQNEEQQEDDGKKSSKKKPSKKASKKPAKPPKEVPIFKLGKWNQKVEFKEKSEIFEGTEDEVRDDCCATCTNKELIRAANTGNMELFKKLLNSEHKISNELQKIGPENSVDVVQQLIKLDDQEMLKYFLNFVQNVPKEFKRAAFPKCYLKNISTGYNNKYAYGRQTRKVTLGRGNKEGNNAFTYDIENRHQPLSQQQVIQALQTASNYKTLELLRLANNFNLDAVLNNSAGFAVQAGNYEIVKELCKNIHRRNNEEVTILHLDALSDDPNHKLSKHDADSIQRYSYSYPQFAPFHLAAINPKNSNILKEMIKENKQCLFLKIAGRGLVHYAAVSESPANIQVLIDENANLKDLTPELNSPLHFAAQYGRAKNVELLLSNEKYSEIKKKNKEGNHPIHLAAENGHVEVIKAFLEKGVKISLPGKDRMQCLHFAAAQNHLDLVKFIFEERKGKINSKDKFKRSPLVMAIRNNSIQVASYLLSKGADYEQADSSSNSPLHYAAAYGSFECIELLIQAGANVNSVNSWNLTPLQIAQMKCHTRCLKYLIKQPNINVNCRDDEGKTLLTNAIIQLYQEYNIEQNIEQIEFWLKANSDPNLADNNGNTPLHYLAQQMDKKDFINELIKKDPEYPITSHNQTFQQYKGYDYWHLTDEERKEQSEIFLQNQAQTLEAAKNLAKTFPDWQDQATPILNEQENASIIQKAYQQIVDEKIALLQEKYTDKFLLKPTLLLLSFKANVNQLNLQGKSPLQTAIQEKSFLTFQILIESENVDLENGFGVDGIFNVLAENLNNKFVYKILKDVLIQSGDKMPEFLNKINQDGLTPLQTVLKKGLCSEEFLPQFKEILELMLAKGADPNIKVQPIFENRVENQKIPENETDYAKQSRIVLQALHQFLLEKTPLNKENFENQLEKKIKFNQQKDQDNEIQKDLTQFVSAKKQNLSQLDSEADDQGEDSFDEEDELNSESDQNQDNEDEDENENEDEIEEEEEEDEEEEEILDDEEEDQEQDELDEEMSNSDESVDSEIPQKKKKLIKKKAFPAKKHAKIAFAAKGPAKKAFAVKASAKKANSEQLIAKQQILEDVDKEQTEKDQEMQRLITQIKSLYDRDFNSSIYHLIIKYKYNYINEIFQIFVERGVDYTQPDLFDITPLHFYIQFNQSYLEQQFNYLVNLPKQKENIELQEFYTKQSILHSFLRGSLNIANNLTKEQQLLKAEEIEEILKNLKISFIKKLLELAQDCLVLQNNGEQIPVLTLFQSTSYSIDNLKEIMQYSDKFKELINRPDKTGKTLLHYMFINKYYSEENLQILSYYDCLSTLDKQEKNQKNTPLHYFLQFCPDSESTQKCTEILLSSPQALPALQTLNKQKQTPLQSYIAHSKHQIIPALVKKIQNSPQKSQIINNRDANGLTAVYQYIINVQDSKSTAKIFAELLSLGANLELINPKDFDDQSLVIVALNLGKYRFIKGLAQHGAKLNIRQDYYKINVDKSNQEFTVVTRELTQSKIPLINTIQKRDEENVDLLLEQGADPNYLDQQKRNSLHHAMNTQKTTADTSFEIEKSLIRFKASVTVDSVGRTPLHYCFIKYSIKNEQDLPNLHLQPIDPYESVSSICQAQKFNVNDLDNLGKSALHYAAIRNSALSIKYLLRNGADINLKDKNGNTPLALALLNKQENACTTLIENGADLHKKAIIKEGLEADQLANTYISEKGEHSLFLLAVKFNFLSLCYLLIEFGFDLLEPFLNALESQNFELLRNLFLQVPAGNQQIKEQNPSTGLNIYHQFAKLKSQHDQAMSQIYDQIEQRNIPHDLQDLQGKTPLIYAIQSDFNQLIDKLLEKNINFNVQDKDGMTPLMHAIKHKNFQLVQKILDSKQYDINLVDKNDRTILHYMVFYYTDNNLETYESKKLTEDSRIQQEKQKQEIELKQAENQLEYTPIEYQNIQLSEYGVNRFGRRYYYNTSYRGTQNKKTDFVDWNFASQQQFIEILSQISTELLNKQDHKGYTAISTALYLYNIFCFVKLVDSKNIDIYQQDKNGLSVVQLSIKDIAKFELLNKYAKDLKLDQVDEKGDTILHLAAKSGLKKILEIVPEEKLSFNTANKLGQTPLHIAIINKQTDFVIELLSKNLEINVFDCRNRLPLHYAIENNDIKIVHYLLKHGSQVYGLDDMLQSPLNLALSHNHLLIAAKLVCHKSEDSEILNSSIEMTKEFVSIITHKILKKSEKIPDIEIMALKEFIKKPLKTNATFIQKICEKEIEVTIDGVQHKEIQITVYQTKVYPVLTYLVKILKVQESEFQFQLTGDPEELKKELQKIKDQEEQARKEQLKLEKQKELEKNKLENGENDVDQSEEDNEEEEDEEEDEDEEDELSQQNFIFGGKAPRKKKVAKFSSNFGGGFAQQIQPTQSFGGFGFQNSSLPPSTHFGNHSGAKSQRAMSAGFGYNQQYQQKTLAFGNNNNNAFGGFGGFGQQLGGFGQQFGGFGQQFGGFGQQFGGFGQNALQQPQEQQQKKNQNITSEFDPILANPKNISFVEAVCEKGGSPMEYLTDEKLNDKCLLIEAIQDNDTKLVQIYAKSPVLTAEEFIQKYKKSALHYVINPLEYGSYENKEIFQILLEKFSDLQVTDEKGMTILDQATLQDSGILKEAIEKAGGQMKNKKMLMKRGGTSVITQASWPEDEIDYEEDSNIYLNAIKSKHNLSEEFIPQPDKKAKGAGLGDADGITIVRDDEMGYFDLIQSKVDIRQGPYGQNVFYKMQLLHSKGRSVYFVFTNWGKIGDVWGTQHQCTPFNTLEEAKALFLKIFKEKTGNEWKNKDNFEKKKGKYMIQRRKKHINYKQYIEDFDFEEIEKQKKVTKQFVKEKPINNLINFISNANNIRNSFENYQLDQDLYSLQKQDILSALSKLDSIKKLVTELDEARSNMLNTDINKVFELQETIAVKSSEYYLLIPEKGFLYQALPTIDTIQKVESKQKELSEILDLEVTSKIILGAHLQLENQKMHPTDYIFKSLNIRAVRLEETHPEFKLIQNYASNGSQGNFPNISNIFAIERKGEAERIAQHKHYDNRMILWHGTKGYNLMSILSNGLVPVPYNTGHHGQLFGPGVYFSDSFAKAHLYSHDWGYSHKYKFLLLCEVALGKTKELKVPSFDTKIESEYKAVKGVGQSYPNPQHNIVLSNGAIVPAGKFIKHEDKNVQLQYNEFIVYKESQIRIRYIVQLE